MVYIKRLLLHTCCAPCSIAVIDELRADHEIAVFFYNPNIHPLSEYAKRKAEVVRVCREWNIAMVDQDNEAVLWETEVGAIGQSKEGGSRCSACFRLRLAKTAVYARNHGFDLFATSLTSGRRKNSAVINAIGRAVSEIQGVAFLDEDWKKGGRQAKAHMMVTERGIYQQSYCGCRFSLEEALARTKADAKRDVRP
jgi:hypothetical protein